MRTRALFSSLTVALVLSGCLAPPQNFPVGSELWHAANPEFEGTHSPNPEAHRVLVGVIDAGLDYNAPAIRNHIHVFATPPSSGREYGVGYDGIGADFFPNFRVINAKDGKDISDDLMLHDHGTHVAQLVALNDPAIGLIPVRVFPLPLEAEDERSAAGDPFLILKDHAADARLAHRSVDAIARSVDFAVQHGATIANLSLGLNLDELLEEDRKPVLDHVAAAISSRLQTTWQNCLMVVAAGNEKTVLERTTQAIPATLDDADLLSVGALKDNVSIAHYSNRGRFVDIYVRGTDISSAVPAESTKERSRRMKMSGTSMASPIVAHAAAQVKAIDPSLNPHELRALLLNTADVKTMAIEISEEPGAILLEPIKVRVLNMIKARSLARSLLVRRASRRLWLTPPYAHGHAAAD